MSAELTALVQLREATRALLEAERDLDRPDETLLPLRQQLNTLYDAYVASYGPLHRATLIQGTPDPRPGNHASPVGARLPWPPLRRILMPRWCWGWSAMMLLLSTPRKPRSSLSGCMRVRSAKRPPTPRQKRRPSAWTSVESLTWR
ncbi:hypothetical protein [Thermosporothrix hazakensis]|uniref:hypothetical protein n=1 Tax=Thermosporothrix hazakensis TaxID=644383 RepID=UPI0014769E6D|nr:hypothetical protein [Thermosporothrix hazakensis]